MNNGYHSDPNAPPSPQVQQPPQNQMQSNYLRSSPSMGSKSMKGYSGGLDFNSFTARNTAHSSIHDGPLCETTMPPGATTAAYLGNPLYEQENEMMNSGEWATPADGGTDVNESRMDVRDPRHIIVRHIVVTINTTLAEAAADPERAVWKTDVNHLHTYQTKRGNKAGTNNDPNHRSGDITKAVITRASITQVHNTSPIPLAMFIPGMNGNHYNNSVRSLYVFLGPMTKIFAGTEDAGIEIHRLNEDAAKLASNKYSHYDEAKLMKSVGKPVKTANNNGVHRSHSTIPIDHPIVDILRKPRNMESLGFTSEMFEGKKTVDVRNDIVKVAVSLILTEIIQKMPFTDLSKFQVAFRPADGKAFDDPSPLSAITANGNTVAALLHQPFTVSLVLRLEYHLRDSKPTDPRKPPKQKNRNIDKTALKGKPIIMPDNWVEN